MNWDINPFQELYLSDSVSEEAFVELFSPVPLTSAINPLFQEGNVVLSGTQGCGKSMILRLFFPKTRIAYADKNITFPVDPALSTFVSAGVNLVKSGICEIGQVTLGKGDEFDIDRLPYFFGDFFNLLVIQDLFKNLRTIASRKDVFGDIVKLEAESKFVECVMRQDCWFGLLEGCVKLTDIEEKVSRRIESYRRWTSNPDNGVPELLSNNKTSIGEPIARTVECLKRSGVFPNDALVFVRVDQLEELHQEASQHQKKIRAGFRQMLNRAFASRDLRLHYRIGTRRYGWNQPEHLTVLGSGARLEARRDYLLVDLEDILIRKEARRRWMFPEFAADAFRRRLKWALDLPILPNINLFVKVFGKHPTPRERANRFAQSNPSADQLDRVLHLSSSEDWTSEWVAWLRAITESDPLEGVLAAAWGRQTGGKGRRSTNRLKPPPDNESWQKKWWRKERLMQAVLQLAARRAQRLLWWGSDDVISLSAPNITAFLHVCHGIWDLFLKEEKPKSLEKRLNLFRGDCIAVDTQAAGVQSASRQWHEKLIEQPGGDVRRRFIDQLGRRFREHLRTDAAMSYPGGNGFSLKRDDLQDPIQRPLWQFLAEAVGYGDLIAGEHTTKNKKGEARIKFYLNPILSPVFQIPAAHTKEPLYWNIQDVMAIAHAAQLPFAVDAIKSDPQKSRVNKRNRRPSKALDTQRFLELF